MGTDCQLEELRTDGLLADAPELLCGVPSQVSDACSGADIVQKRPCPAGLYPSKSGAYCSEQLFGSHGYEASCCSLDPNEMKDGVCTTLQEDQEVVEVSAANSQTLSI